jgi:hypothetical protein
VNEERKLSGVPLSAHPFYLLLLSPSPSFFSCFRNSHHRPPREIFLAQEEFVRMYREESGRPIVELAHMEIAEPSIEVAFARCVEQGATLVAVSPFFLSPGRHWQEVRAARPHRFS